MKIFGPLDASRDSADADVSGMCKDGDGSDRL
jgi:hypothetical protein